MSFSAEPPSRSPSQTDSPDSLKDLDSPSPQPSDPVRPGKTSALGSSHGHSSAPLWTLALGALGVIYGDIGTSPLYTLKECFLGSHKLALDQANILGVLSLIFWSLSLVVSLKYLTFVMRADNHGEGGIFALLALVNSSGRKLTPLSSGLMVLAALTGASLLYGDGVLTPAISVLSAVEGLEVATAAAKPFTLWITCGILIGLFMIQRHGTARIGGLFGPVMILWFTTLGTLGAINIFKNPTVLRAINPIYALEFFHLHHFHGFIVLGSVVLCITGGEAIYADMGHFGRKAIQLSWYGFTFPALLLNYFGQGALFLSQGSAVKNPFYEVAPSFMIVPLVLLATAATIIASQAMISGVYSLSRQAIQMGYMPRLLVRHTSSHTEGQIYVPLVNYAMMFGCLAVVLIFRESTRLASAYGIAVTANMVLTSVLFLFVTLACWKWSKWKAIPLVLLFLTFDLAYFGSNAIKFMDGGWFPTAVALGVLTIMLTWRDGRRELSRRINETTIPLYTDAAGGLSLHPQPGTGALFLPKQHLQAADLPVEFLTHEMLEDVLRVPGTAVFMAVSAQRIPTVLMHHLKLNHSLHEQVILLSVRYRNVPFVPPEEALEVHDLGQKLYQATVWFGFMQTPEVPGALLGSSGVFHKPLRPETTTFFLGHQTLLIARHRDRMMRWRKALFVFMSRNATPATTYFCLPSERVIEIGMHIEL
ncbi:MAG: potassium transporter Kup [Candidatus Sericytochromatia bacterium]